MPVAPATEPAEQAGDARGVVNVSGELDIAAAGRLRSAVGDLMGQGVRHVEIDMEGCTFLDSSGMGALLWAAHRLRAVGGDLAVLHVHGAPARALQISGIDTVLAVRD